MVTAKGRRLRAMKAGSFSLTSHAIGADLQDQRLFRISRRRMCRQLLSAPHVKYLIADWTSKKDKAIEDELSYTGRTACRFICLQSGQRRPKF